MSEFLASNDWQWRLLRTIVQGILGVVNACLSEPDHGLTPGCVAHCLGALGRVLVLEQPRGRRLVVLARQRRVADGCDHHALGAGAPFNPFDIAHCSLPLGWQVQR